MTFAVKIRVKRGGLRQLEVESESVQDALDWISETYPGYVLIGIDLIPSKGKVGVYSNGEQFEINPSDLYLPKFS